MNRALLAGSILLILVSAICARADEPDRIAYLSLDLNARGDASLDLFANFDPHLIPGLANGIGQAMGCQLGDVAWNQDDEGYSLTAHCDRAFRRLGLVIAGEISTSPIVRVLRSANAVRLTVDITLPDAAFEECSLADANSAAVDDDSACVFHVPVPEDTGARIRVSYGYRSSDAARLLTSGLFALLSISLSLWARSGALRKAQLDRVAAWFGYARLLQWTMLGNYFAWWIIADLSRMDDFVFFALSSIGFAPAAWARAPLGFLILLVPPGLLNFLATLTSQPVQAQVRGSEWTVREVAIQAALGQALIILPLGFFLAGMGSLFNAEDQRPAVIWLFIAFFSYVLIARVLAKSRDYNPYALATGELRDRIFSLAGIAGVKLQQIYLLPTSKARIANAYARTGNSVILTDYLLQHLSKREVDAVVAHEITHLQRRHPRWLSITLLIGCGAAGLLGAILEDRLPRGVPVVAVLLLLVLIIVYALSRHFERSADSGAAKLTGDPEALITALVACRRVTITGLLASELSWLLAMKSCSPGSSIPI